MIKQILFSAAITLISITTFKAKVIGVTDGDSIIILTDDSLQLKIRLEAIDCPEMNQDFGTKAKQTTVDICFGKQVTIQKTGLDRYGRTLAFVYVGDTCINNYLIDCGMAWHYKKYNNDSVLADLENRAQLMKIGLWSQLNPIPPWDWRRKK